MLPLLSFMGCNDVCLEWDKGGCGVKWVVAVCLVEATRGKWWESVSGSSWWTVVTEWVISGNTCVAICWRWTQNRLPLVVNVMLIASAKSRSARGASHQLVFMGSCLAIGYTCLLCLLSTLLGENFSSFELFTVVSNMSARFLIPLVVCITNS